MLGDESVSAALLRRAKEAMQQADAERRRLEALSTRLRALEDVYRAVASAEPKRVRVVVRLDSTDTAIPEHLSVRALAALMEVISGEVAQVLADLEVPRG